MMRFLFNEPYKGNDEKLHAGEGDCVSKRSHTGSFYQEPILDTEIDSDYVILP